EPPGYCKSAQRTCGTRSLGYVPEEKTSGYDARKCAHSLSSSSPGRSSRACGSAGLEITYFSEAQLPKSISRQRLLQNGMNSPSLWTFFLQIGHSISISKFGEESPVEPPAPRPLVNPATLPSNRSRAPW